VTTAAGAVWLYTYRVSAVLEHIEYRADGSPIVIPSRPFGEQPWWSVPGAVALVLIGVAIVMWLVPVSRRPVKRFANRFANPS
jgi:hypothetical protein